MKQLFEEHFTNKVNEQGERIEKPENYDTWNSEFHKRIINSARQHSKTWAILCEAYNKAETVTFTPDWMEFMDTVDGFYFDHMDETPQMSWFIATKIVDGVEVPLEEPKYYWAYRSDSLRDGSLRAIGCDEYEQAQSKVIYRGWNVESNNLESVTITDGQSIVVFYLLLGSMSLYKDAQKFLIATRNDLIKNGVELIFK